MSLCNTLVQHRGEWFTEWAFTWGWNEWGSGTVPIPTFKAIQTSEDIQLYGENFKRTTITFIDPAGIPPEKERQPPE